MLFNEPKVSFVSIDLKDSVVTASCPDGVTDGGTYCVDSDVTTNCGTPMQSTNTGDDEKSGLKGLSF